MTTRLATGLLAALLVQAPAIAAETSPPPVGWMEVGLPGVSSTRPAARRAFERIGELPLRLVEFEELKGFLQELDKRGGVLEEAGKLLGQGKQLALGMKLAKAADAYRRAIQKIEGGFARFYDRGRLAEPLLQLGVVLFQSGQADEARKAFQRAASLVPTLELAEGYYSPSVRQAFDKARKELGRLDPGIPPPEEIGRVCSAAGLRGMVVASVERLGDRPMLRMAVYDARARRFTAVETVMVDASAGEAAGDELAGRLQPAVAEVAGVKFTVRPPSLDGGVDLPDGAAGADEPEDPWYIRHWWIWPVTAVVVGAAITLPLTVFREDVVDVTVRF